jgi:hypothetical protein
MKKLQSSFSNSFNVEGWDQEEKKTKSMKPK